MPGLESTAAAALLVLLVVAGDAHAFLATPLNTSDPDVANILCPELTTGTTRDHKWITREAVRRNIRQFFLSDPPPDKPDFNPPPSASLTELYHAYYGDSASPARFIKAVNSVAAGNVYADSAYQLRYDPGIQADGETLDDLQYGLANRYPQLLTSIMVNEAYPAARSMLGLSLHSLQKFYAHSTWIEQGHKGILAELGLPGYAFEGAATPEEAVCTPCPNEQGLCEDNVVSGAGLTTGFYTYTEDAANDFLVEKPASGVKCSHGGVLDESASADAIGGINKDTASPCFSPHYHLHDTAVELAVQATDYYLNVILDAIGNDYYRLLFDLYSGSALSIVIDTTGSMGDDIAAVQSQVAEIVASTSTQVYVLVPYNDPAVGPVTKTEDPDEFLAAVNALSAYGGGDSPEMYWQGLQLALTNTPDYGNIFTFTDAPGKDGEIMESVIALAERGNMKVTTVYSGPIYYTSLAAPPGQEGSEGAAEESEERQVTYVPEYQYLADTTGGLFIPSDKFEIDAITPILGDSVESVDVDITMLKDLKGIHKINFPIDDSVLDFEIQLAGYITTAVLQDFTGTSYNLMDESALEANPNIDVIAYTAGLRAIKFYEPRYGVWSLDLDSGSETYSLTVSGNSTLSWLGGFSILDPSPPHPHYMDIIGRPLTNTIYYLDVMLIGYLESQVVSVHSAEYLDRSGNKLRTIVYDGEIDDEFYIRSEFLPEEPFFVSLCGLVLSGNEFCRLLPVLMTPVQASVEVTATQDELSARPGESNAATFLITNFGLESDFVLTGTDDLKFLDFLDPATLHLTTNGTGTVAAHFTVPSGTAPGTVSTFTLTAQSVKQSSSVNSAVTQFIVLPETQDLEPPTCVLSEEPDCTGFTYAGVCTQKNWTTTATLQDPISGLSNVYARPEGLYSEVSGLVHATTSPVTLDYTATCCSSQVDMIGVDVMGNVGKCTIDMGVLGGMILDLEAESVGITWVYLHWTITPTMLDIDKYELLINEDLTTQFRCYELECYYNVTFLEPCSGQGFELTPYFKQDTNSLKGEPAFTSASTLDQEPGVPINGEQIASTETTATVSWDGVNSECVEQYQVCYHPYGDPGMEVCERTSDTQYLMRGLEACSVYIVTVAAVSPSGILSPAHEFSVNSDEADPEAPRNVVVEMATDTTVMLAWDDPLNRVNCVDKYRITYGEIHEDKIKEVKQTHAHISPFSDHYATISDLLPCTNYTFTISAVSYTGRVGPGATRDAATLEIEEIVPVDPLIVDTETTTSLHASWFSSDVCLSHFAVCHYEANTATETCQETGDFEIDLINLLPCTDYELHVSLVTPSGNHSNRTYGEGTTLEVKPSRPENLVVTTYTAHTIDVTFDPPATNPQCVSEYDYQEINLDANAKTSGTLETRVNPYLESIFIDLDACTNYEIQVRAKTPGGLASSWSSVAQKTSEDTPSAPRNIEFIEATASSIDIQFFQPEENFRCVAYYEVSWSGGSEIVAPADGGSLPIEVYFSASGLAACTDYTFTVTAYTATDDASVPATLAASTIGC